MPFQICLTANDASIFLRGMGERGQRSYVDLQLALLSTTVCLSPWQPMQVHGNLCKSMATYASPWQPMQVHGNLCKSMATYASPWQPMQVHGNLCKSMATYARLNIILMRANSIGQFYLCPRLCYLYHISQCTNIQGLRLFRS